MGQAKQRGTFEERKAAAIVRDEAEATVRMLRHLEQRKARALVAPEERWRHLRTGAVLAIARGLASSSIAIMNADDLARRNRAP